MTQQSPIHGTQRLADRAGAVLPMHTLLDIARNHETFAAAAIDQLRQQAEALSKTACDWRVYKALVQSAQYYLDSAELPSPEDMDAALDEIDALLDPEPDDDPDWSRGDDRADFTRDMREIAGMETRFFGGMS